MSKVIMIVGPPASGKTKLTKEYLKRFVHLSRDIEGGKTISLVSKMETELKAGNEVVLDNTFPTIESRKPFIQAAHKLKADVHCDLMMTSIEDSQINALHRMIDLCGSILFDANAIAEHNKTLTQPNPNLFPPASLFVFRKKYEVPTLAEGFKAICQIPFEREPQKKSFKNKGAFFDYDDTLRKSIGKQKYPTKPSEVQILPRRKETLQELKDKGYILIGVSNQSGVSKKQMSAEGASQCFEKTNELLGIDIDFHFCPHSASPVNGGCYCRKPQSGMGVHFIHKHKLDISKSFMVGDQTSDKTFARRLGLQYHDQAEFFK